MGLTLSKAFKQNKVKSVTKIKSDFNYDGNQTFFRFYRGYDKFKEMSVDTKYNRMKEFNKPFLSFKSVKTRESETSFKKRENYEKC